MQVFSLEIAHVMALQKYQGILAGSITLFAVMGYVFLDLLLLWLYYLKELLFLIDSFLL